MSDEPVTLAQIAARHRSIAYFVKYGRQGFRIVRSAEAPRAGALTRQPSRFRPPRDGVRD